MTEPTTLKGIHRRRLMEKLHSRYDNADSFSQRLKYLRKKYLWLLFVEGTRLFKRSIDIVIGLFIFILFLPFMLLIGSMIKFSDGGPVLYLSHRVGKWGKEFVFPKFRTMKPNSEELLKEMKKFNKHSEDIKFKMENDPRVTPFGYWLRKSSLDELPQLWCVIKGEMSLVGPRPPLPVEVEKYTLEQRKRLDATPGLTCIWQVSGRSEIPFKRQVELDVAYIESQSLLLDMKLILQTIPAVLFGKGAY